MLVVAPLVPSGVSAVGWFCEGRACGLFACCCTNLKESKDPNCQRVVKPVANGKTICGTECGCKFVIQATQDHPVVLSSVSPVTPPFEAILPAPRVIPAPEALATSPVISLPARGPPPTSATLFNPSLRAPPAS